MKVKDFQEIIKSDIQALEEQVAYLEGHIAKDPEVTVEELASVEFINDLKDQSEGVQSTLDDMDIPEVEYYNWVEEKGKDAKIEIQGEMFWSPQAAALLEEYLN